MKSVLIVALLVLLVVAVLMILAPSGGPRVTQIRRERIDEDKDRD